MKEGKAKKTEERGRGITLVMSKAIIRERIMLLTIYQKIKKISNHLSQQKIHIYSLNEMSWGDNLTTNHLAKIPTPNMRIFLLNYWSGLCKKLPKHYKTVAIAPVAAQKWKVSTYC